MTKNVPLSGIECDYSQTLKRLYQCTTNPKWGLDRMRKLLAALDGKRSCPTIIQVVGTNGKGSTCAFLESILQANGVRTGLFTSPHLCSARERIHINGTMVSKELFVIAANKTLEIAQQLQLEPSFFECVVGMAYWLFQEQFVDVAIFEAGLGGRLDATTATDATILGVTSIDLDHQNILGDRIELIAQEKIAAAKAGQEVYSVSQHQSVKEVIDSAQKQVSFNLHNVIPSDGDCGLYGTHQRSNAGLARALAYATNLPLDPQKVHDALAKTQWPGRFEIFYTPEICVLDGAHNPGGIRVLRDALSAHPQFHQQALVMVYGSLASAQVSEKISLLRTGQLSIQEIFLHQPKNPRAVPVKDLRQLFVDYGWRFENLHEYTDFDSVIRAARNHQARILVLGSLYTVGEIRAQLCSQEMDWALPNY